MNKYIVVVCECISEIIDCNIFLIKADNRRIAYSFGHDKLSENCLKHGTYHIEVNEFFNNVEFERIS